MEELMNTMMNRSILRVSLGVALCLVLAACAPMEGLFVPVTPALTVKQETVLGRQAFPLAVQRLGGPYADAELQDYVRQLGLRLAKRSDRPELDWRFVVVDRSEPGLYIFPAGRVAISRGLIVGLESRDELMFVLAHAVAHAVDAPFAGSPTYAVVNVARELLDTGKQSGPTPDSAADRLAKALLDRSYRTSAESAVDQKAERYLAAAAGFSGVELGGAQPWCRSGGLGDFASRHDDELSRVHPCVSQIRLYSTAARGDDRAEQDAVEFIPLRSRLQNASEGYEMFAVARNLERDGQFSEAINSYLLAASAAPDEAAILVGAGLAYLRAGDLHSARLHLEKAVQLQPDYYRSLMGLGYVYLQKGRVDDAENRLKQSVGLRPVTENIFLLAQAREALGRRKSATALYRTVVDADRWSKFGKTAAARLKELEND
jgi:predicted Zn-dependent protease